MTTLVAGMRWAGIEAPETPELLYRGIHSLARCWDSLLSRKWGTT